MGASGFSYPSWKGGFYPDDAGPRDFLRLYAQRLSSVELNNTFYRLPSEGQFERWAAQTPPGFRFAVKMTRSITHFGRLDELAAFCERVGVLGERLGPILVRLPDGRPRDDGWLRLVLDSVDPRLELAFDFRDPSWAGADDLLRAAGAVRVSALDAEAPFRYLRLREGPYDERALAHWAERVRALLDAGLRVYCYFRHEEAPTAPRYAEALLRLVAGRR